MTHSRFFLCIKKCCRHAGAGGPGQGLHTHRAAEDQEARRGGPARVEHQANHSENHLKGPSNHISMAVKWNRWNRCNH